ncbi:MAG: hypothetical protein SGCHY_003893 [Lobulomycetales sp.]
MRVSVSVAVALGLAAQALASTRVLMLGNGDQTHSSLVKRLSADHSLVYAADSLLDSYGLRKFDILLLLGVSPFTPKDLMAHLDAGGNILIAAGSKVPENLREFAFEFSVDFDDRLTTLYDPVSALDSSPDKTSFYAQNYAPAAANVVPSALTAPLVFSDAIAHRLTGKNRLAFPVLSANPSTYSFLAPEQGKNSGKSVSETTPFIGTKIQLISALQTRGNARVLFCASVDFFSDAHEDTNAGVVDQIVAWTSQKSGVLRIHPAAHHHRTSQPGQQHGIYRIKDEMTYSLGIQQLDAATGTWTPYTANDVQFQVKMLDDYLRLPMTSDSQGMYRVNFTLPDVYGVFTFKTSYWRHGLTYLDAADIVQVRPYRHDDYPRFLSSAWVYYVNVASMMGAFLALCAVWLFHRDAPTKEKPKHE